MDRTITSCEFNSKNCTSCANYTMCSLLNTEKHLNKLENQIINIFESLNSLIEFSVENGKEIKDFRETLPQKEDILEEFSHVYEEIEKLKELVIIGNNELKDIIMQYSDEVKDILKRLSLIEKASVSEKGKEQQCSDKN